MSTDVCKDDCGGQTASWAAANGYALSNNNDTGEGVTFARDLDHNSANVQKNVKAYLHFLLNDMGYAGVRYDMVKGYAAKFTALYNADAKPTFSVGEYFDGNKQLLTNWINGTKVNGVIQSAAFDFNTRYAVRDATNYSNWTKLDHDGLATDPTYARYAVTFVENHDTDRFLGEGKDTLALKQALALLLTINRTPQLYYGTEVLMNGTKSVTDGNVRKDFPGGRADDKHNAFTAEGRTKAQNDMLSWKSRLLHWRPGHEVITKGTQTHYY